MENSYKAKITVFHENVRGVIDTDTVYIVSMTPRYHGHDEPDFIDITNSIRPRGQKQNCVRLFIDTMDTGTE
jgi:hypothetical protein